MVLASHMHAVYTAARTILLHMMTGVRNTMGYLHAAQHCACSMGMAQAQLRSSCAWPPHPQHCAISPHSCSRDVMPLSRSLPPTRLSVRLSQTQSDTAPCMQHEPACSMGSLTLVRPGAHSTSQDHAAAASHRHGAAAQHHGHGHNHDHVATQGGVQHQPWCLSHSRRRRQRQQRAVTQHSLPRQLLCQCVIHQRVLRLQLRGQQPALGSQS
jgi:hypothetical protein